MVFELYKMLGACIIDTLILYFIIYYKNKTNIAFKQFVYELDNWIEVYVVLNNPNVCLQLLFQLILICGTL